MKRSLLAAGSFARVTTRLGQVRCLNANILTEPVKSVQTTSRPKTKISDEKIRLLERLSLVDFANEEGIRRLEDAIDFADPIRDVETEGVEPMYTVLEDKVEALRLRGDDEPEPDGRDATRAEILSNAALVDEDFFVAPPGNIPLEVKPEKYKKS